MSDLPKIEFAGAFYRWLDGNFNPLGKRDPYYLKGYNDALLDVKLKLVEMVPAVVPRTKSSAPTKNPPPAASPPIS